MDKKQRHLDFYIPELKLCIEYDEDHHKTQQEKDKIREQEIFNKIPDLKLLRITREEYQADPDATLKKCLDMINNNIM